MIQAEPLIRTSPALCLAIRKAADVPGVRRGLDSLLIDPATGP